MVTAPVRRGFGSRLIERILAHDLGGSAKISFAPEGVVCALDADAAEVLAADGAEARPFPKIGSM
jgi:two-component sensor histidine kinase